MSWEFLVALIIAVPLITFPAVFVWYVNGGGLFQAIKDRVSVRGSKRHVASLRGAGPAEGRGNRRGS